MNKNKLLAGLLLSAAASSFNATAGQDVTFKLAATTDGQTHSTPMPITGQRGFSYEVVLDYEYQGNGGRCTILYYETSCTIENMNNGATLANIHWGRAMMNQSIQQVSSWMNIGYQDKAATVLIPSSNVHFYYINNEIASSTLTIYGRPSHLIGSYGRASLQTTENANNLGFKIANLPSNTRQDGAKFPMLAGCMNLAVHNEGSSNITRVNFTQVNSATGPMTATLCVPGNDTTTFVGINALTERVASISTKVPSELAHLYK